YPVSLVHFVEEVQSSRAVPACNACALHEMAQEDCLLSHSRSESVICSHDGRASMRGETPWVTRFVPIRPSFPSLSWGPCRDLLLTVSLVTCSTAPPANPYSKLWMG